MNFYGIDVHKDRLTVAKINEYLDVDFIKDMTIDEFIPYLKKTNAKVIAIDAPYKLNSGLMNDQEYRNSLNPNLKAHHNKKVSEYELSRRGINPFSTPGSIDEVVGWNTWMKTGFTLYKHVRELQFVELNSKTIKNDQNGFIEVFPHACFTVLLGYVPSKKNSTEGLNERIELLEEIGFKNIDLLIDGLSKHKKTDQLDALVAAYTAYLCFNHKTNFVGDVDEGQIVIPHKILKDSYKKKKNID